MPHIAISSLSDIIVPKSTYNCYIISAWRVDLSGNSIRMALFRGKKNAEDEITEVDRAHPFRIRISHPHFDRFIAGFEDGASAITAASILDYAQKNDLIVPVHVPGE